MSKTKVVNTNEAKKPNGFVKVLKAIGGFFTTPLVSYIIKRVLIGLLTVFIVSTLTFFLMNAVPGNPFIAEKAMSAEAIAAQKAKYGLDKPLIIQYFNYMGNLLKGDFGASLKQRGMTVNQIIFSKLPVSAAIGGLAALLALVVGVIVGSISALNRGKWIDNIIIVFSTCGIAFPSFVICSVMQYYFINILKLSNLNPASINPLNIFSTSSSIILPIIALAIYPMSYITRLMRSSMLDVIDSDYMRTARAKGLSRFSCLFKHALRNAILPVVTYAGPMIANILTGSFVMEKIFRVPGLGKQFVSSITNRDYTVIMGTTIILATLVIFMNVVVDIVYKLIDPRIELK